METSLADSQTDSYFPTKWSNGYTKQKDVSDTHIQRRSIIKINHERRICISRSIFKSWVSQFREGRTSVRDKPMPGRPVGGGCWGFVNNVRRVTLQEVANQLSIDKARHIQVSILHKSIADRYRPVSYPQRPAIDLCRMLTGILCHTKK